MQRFHCAHFSPTKLSIFFPKSQSLGENQAKKYKRQENVKKATGDPRVNTDMCRQFSGIDGGMNM